MTTTLHLGVIDIPYAYEREVVGKKGKVLKKKKKIAQSQTTGDVATILEEKYHVMELFFETHQEQIVHGIEEGLAHAVEAMASGSPIDDPFAVATQGISEAFKVFVIEGAVEHLGIPGTPTAAALKGVSHRKAHPYAKANNRRPSFVDTGMYVDSFISWID